MQIDVNVNMTLEVDDAEWESFLDSMKEEDEDGNWVLEGLEEDYLEEFVDSELNGEELSTASYGRAWVCSVDNCSIL